MILLSLSACTSSTAVTTTTIEPLPPPSSPNVRATTTLVPTTTEPVGPFPPPIQGYFPDGTDFILTLRSQDPEEVNAIRAHVLYEDNGAVWDVGYVDFVPGELAGPQFAADVFSVPTGPIWHARIDFFDDIWEMLGPNAEDVVGGAIQGRDIDGFPVLDLAPPFRWSTQYDPTGPMEVVYETFAVTVGCDADRALVCEQDGKLQMIGLGGVDPPELPIEFLASRPISDPFYLDLGPLTERRFADVLWTGDEMIVWGGLRNDVVWHDDGAAYNPETDTWRMLAESPISDSRRSCPIWTGEEIVLISSEGTFGYDPDSDAWREIAGPASGSGSCSDQVAIDGAVYVWATPDLLKLASGAHEWEKLPRPEGTWYRSLRDYEGRLLLTSASIEACTGRSFQVWNGKIWDDLPEATSNYADCSNVDQVGVVDGQIVAWGFPTILAKTYDEAAEEWIDVGDPPFRGTEGPSGPVVIGSRLLVPVWELGAIYDPATGEWTEVDLPGPVEDINLVWTGTKILAWVGERSDAWRWTPPG